MDYYVAVFGWTLMQYNPRIDKVDKVYNIFNFAQREAPENAGPWAMA